MLLDVVCDWINVVILWLAEGRRADWTVHYSLISSTY